jgi:hypothetical protein
MRALVCKAKDKSVPLSINARRYIPNAALCEGKFLLETKLPLQAFVTLTLPYHVSPMALDDRFSRWVRSVQAHNRLTLGWIRAYEQEPERHIHAVLLAAGSLDCFHAALIWRELVARRYPQAARVEPYRYGIGGLAYVLKSLDRLTEDVQFSRNVSAFVPESETRFFVCNSAERRQLRRIRRQQISGDRPTESLDSHKSRQEFGQ